MIRKLILRIFIGGAACALLAIGAATCAGLMAMSRPSFYSAALDRTLSEAEADAALDEIELAIDALGLFIATDAEQIAQLNALPEEALADAKWGQRSAAGRLPEAIAALKGYSDDDFTKCSFRLSQRHIDSWLKKECGGGSKELRNPCVALSDGLIKVAATVATPVGDLVVSFDFELAQSDPADLCLELHALRIGRLPLPAKTLLQQLVKLNPDLPAGFTLDLAQQRPRLHFTGVPREAKVWFEDLQVTDGELLVSLRRVGA
ncbi:MAG: hypothetical protein AAGJ46_02720 [Planctomycetota bacterium]